MCKVSDSGARFIVEARKPKKPDAQNGGRRKSSYGKIDRLSRESPRESKKHQLGPCYQRVIYEK